MITMKRIRYLLAFFFVTLLIGIIFAVYTRKSSTEKSDGNSSRLPANIDLTLKNAVFSEMRDGSAVWELTAKTTEYDQNGAVAYLTGIRMQFNDTAYGKIVVTAGKARYSTDTKDVQMRENVVVTTDTGANFKTGSLDYNSATSSFSTAEPVQFHQNRLYLKATGIKMFLNDKKARFPEKVDAVLEGRK